jgi:SSS family solute:Na+ symporter
VGLAVRLVLFVMTPTIFGVDNTILYVDNSVFDSTFDGWPTFIAFGASLVAYLAVALMTPSAQLRGLDIQVAQDLDDVLEDPDLFTREEELVPAKAGVGAT